MADQNASTHAHKAHTGGQESAAAPAFAGTVSFGADIDIHAGQRLPHLDSGTVKAYAATGRGAKSGNHFALVCEKSLIPRIGAIPHFRDFENPALIRFVAGDVVDWTPAGEQRFAFVYENTLGRPLKKQGQKAALSWNHDHVVEHIVPALIGVLSDFKNRDFVHANIRPTNLFDGGSDKMDKVVLGDCLSVPPGSVQPALYEPIERAMADPLARGLGTQADDLYALGATLAVLLRHHDPMEGLTDEQVIHQKIEFGSYVALTGKDRFTGGVLELLRGLLYDDSTQRWSLPEIETWLEGQRLSPKQLAKKVKASRPLAFGEGRYFRPHVLAMDLQKNPVEAVAILDNGSFEQWLVRSLEDSAIIGRFEAIMESAAEGTRGVRNIDRLLCQLSVALDPDAPIRYKGLNFRPEGFGHALAATMQNNGDLQPYGEVLSQDIVFTWIDLQAGHLIDAGSLVSRFDSCRAALRQKNAGYGIERAVYTLVPDCPCLSEKLSRYFVRSAEDFILALEDRIAKGNPPERVFDRHIIGFLSVKDRKVLDSALVELNASEDHDRMQGTLGALSEIQRRGRVGALPHITAYLAERLDPLYARYHDRTLRESLRKKVAQIKNGGDISKIAALFEDRETSRSDVAGYRAAMQEFHGLVLEKQDLENRLAQSGAFGRGTGRQVAALVSGCLSALILLILTFYHFSRMLG